MKLASQEWKLGFAQLQLQFRRKRSFDYVLMQEIGE